MAKILEAYPHLLRYEVIEDDLIALTDSSEAIQTFFGTFIGYEALWSGDPAEFERQVLEETSDNAAPVE
jgi:hypothetical protein